MKSWPFQRMSQSRILILAALTSFSCEKSAGPRDANDVPPTITTKSGVEMILIPAGSYEMGNRTGKEDEAHVHTVTLESFLMDKLEVTQAEFDRLHIPNPSHFKAPTLPVEQVTWAQAAFYCNKRSRDEDLQPCYNEANGECDFSAEGYRLPTEAEWEYACRAGTDSDFSFGADARKLGEYAWYADNAGNKTHPVGKKKPNAWGLFDMHGNVAEWCNDVYDKAYYKVSPEANPRGPAVGKENVIRGGAWKSGADTLRSWYRLGDNPGFSDACLARDAIGFRCVRKAPRQ
jgi:formylglycine-generating enzyme required for sulfatase activity